MTGLGPKLPGFNGINDHIASGIRLGMDGFLYISVGDKGIPQGVGRDGKTIQLFGGGVIRVRPDGTGLEVVSTGERNPLSVALSATDEIFTYGNDDDSKKWPNSLTHHIVGGHYGYPYQFLTAPHRALPIMAGEFGGSGAQGICYNEDGLPAEYRGNLFFCDWGSRPVFRFEIKKAGGTFAVVRRTPLVTKGTRRRFPPVLAGRRGGRRRLLAGRLGLQRLARERSADRPALSPAVHGPNAAGTRIRVRRATTWPMRVKALDHPALAVRLESQRILPRKGPAAVPLLVERLKSAERRDGPAARDLGSRRDRRRRGPAGDRRGLGRPVAAGPPPGGAIGRHSPRQRPSLKELIRLLEDRDAAVRREAAIALGRLGDRGAARPLRGPRRVRPVRRLVGSPGDPPARRLGQRRWSRPCSTSAGWSRACG